MKDWEIKIERIVALAEILISVPGGDSTFNCYGTASEHCRSRQMCPFSVSSELVVDILCFGGRVLLY
ncbi:hypothetical protein P8452_56762 [Trifolium repens]|nr:hypothetical protein P8452_56762 [Trifolium repens]